MRTFDASALLDAWEHGYGLPPPQRALALLAYGWPHVPRDELASAPLGRRDAWLARLRIALFGPELAFVATCPHCASVVESTLDAAPLALDAPPPDPRSIEIDGARVTLRAATSADLADLPRDADAARRLLALRVIDAGDTTLDADALTEASLAAIADALAQIDPGAATDLALDCPDCGARWHGGLDIAAFLWREIDAWARRTLREVHALARAYAWREADVLALSPTRRKLYLELCGA
ncbi:hypothetical protein [Tahibacter soli]|uniref:Phage baseplate protein n=1 Tax=Tahibacter soli TaxID=2983605 RepID=A0A9X3YS19_9GAMM|nr:hypothetical protein [Tahibacter soli]MDC8016068.1 hypothetical protein [Tahibacter soli]